MQQITNAEAEHCCWKWLSVPNMQIGGSKTTFFYVAACESFYADTLSTG
jgi:hypothetical protein